MRKRTCTVKIPNKISEISLPIVMIPSVLNWLVARWLGGPPEDIAVYTMLDGGGDSRT